MRANRESRAKVSIAEHPVATDIFRPKKKRLGPWRQASFEWLNVPKFCKLKCRTLRVGWSTWVRCCASRWQVYVESDTPVTTATETEQSAPEVSYSFGSTWIRLSTRLWTHKTTSSTCCPRAEPQFRDGLSQSNLERKNESITDCKQFY